MAIRRLGVSGRRFASVRVVFASRSLRNCQLSLALVRTADLAQLVAISAYLFEQNGLGGVAVYGVLRTVVPAVGVPIATALTGRLGHGPLLRAMAGLSAAASVGVVVTMIADGPLWVLLALAALIGVADGSFRPVTSALMPCLVTKPSELVACTAAAGFLDGATTLLGPLLAGLLLAVGGPMWTIAVTAVLLIAAGLLAGRLQAPAMLAPAAETPRRAAAVRALFGKPEAAVIAVLVPCQTIVRGALNVIVVVFVIESLHLDDSAIGLLLGAIGVGGMLGLPAALAIAGVGRLYRSLGIGLVLWGTPLALAAAFPHFAVAAVLFAIVGVGNVLLDVSAFSALPRAVPDHAQAKAFGLLEALFQVGMALGAALAGVLVDLIGVRGALVSIGVFLPVAAVVAVPWLRRFDARLERHDVEVDLLRRQSLFAGLPIPVLDNLGTRLGRAEFSEGDVIMAEGEYGDRYVLIADGTVTFSQGGAVINVLETGAAFGEIALLRDTPRTATATATSRVSARTLDRDAFLAALGCDPRARLAADAVADERLARRPSTE